MEAEPKETSSEVIGGCQDEQSIEINNKNKRMKVAFDEQEKEGQGDDDDEEEDQTFKVLFSSTRALIVTNEEIFERCKPSFEKLIKKATATDQGSSGEVDRIQFFRMVCFVMHGYDGSYGDVTINTEERRVFLPRCGKSQHWR